MNILPELSAIAAAKYGLHLKDAIYKAFDKLVQDSRFELIKDPGTDDYAEFDNNLKTYANRNTTCTTIRYILILIQILNGRKGYYTKKTTSPLEPRDTIFYWIDMLLKEFMNSGNGYSYDNHTRGSGVVNGIKMRAAIYYILDILNCEDALYADSVTSGVMSSPYFFMGRDITQIVIHGTASGVGTLDTTDGKYYVDVEIYDILKDVTTTLNICLGDSALGEGDTHTITSPTYSNYGDSFYRVTVKDFNCDIETNYTLTRENEITPGAVKEKTGTPPMKFYTVDTSLLDWVINGAVGGVGKLGKNYLKQRTDPIPNGAAGSYLSSSNSWEDVITGITFNTGEATKVMFVFKNTSDSNITPTDVGDVMLVEGSSIPTEYNTDTTLYKKNVMQGTFTYNDPSSLHVGNQIIYCGDDGKGGVNNYDMATYVPKRCKTYSIDIESNTTYSLRIFNSSANMTVKIYLLTAPGTITPTFEKPGNTVKTIPGNQTFTDSLISTEQWVNLIASHDNYTSAYNVPIDCRPFTYENCESFATLKAGTYKVMVDIFGNYTWNFGDYYVIGFYTYRGCSEDNWSGGSISDNEWFALISEDNTFIIPKTDILNSEWARTKNENLGAPFPNYYHNEFTFTLTQDTKLGLFHRAYYQKREPYFRFMIVDSDVEPVYFETTDVYPADQIGYSAWEKYQVKVSVVVYNNAVPGEAALWVKKDIPVDDFLYDGDSISLTSSSVDITTFEGWNSIVVDSDVQPTIYIKYQQ